MIEAERKLGLKADAIRRLAALAVAIPEDARRLTTRLRLSNNESKALDSMGHRWWRLAGMDEARARRRLYRLGEERYRDRVLLAWARASSKADPAPWIALAQLPLRFTPPKFPLRAADFVARGVAEGPQLGHVLTLAEDAWLAADFPLEPAMLASIADQAVARLMRDPKS
jgi:poly(A) polymerase